MIQSRVTFVKALPVFIVLTFLDARAQTLVGSYVPVKMNLYTATSDLWRTDHGFRSTIRLKNMLSVTEIDVTVTLYMADGTPCQLAPTHLGKSGVATVDVNAAIAIAPSSCTAHLSQTGSATLQYRYDWPGAVLGTISILDQVRSLQYLSHFVFQESTPTAASVSSHAAMSLNIPNRIDGMWWKYSQTSIVYLSIANPNTETSQADVVIVDQQKQQIGTRHILLTAHASTVLTLDEISSATTSMVGGIDISYIGSEGSMLFSGGIEDDKAGYSAALALSMANMSIGVVPKQTTCTVAAPGLMVGAPDPMEGFPAGVSFLLFGFARNTGLTPVTLHGTANYMDKAGPVSIVLPDIILAAGETRDLHLAAVVHLPFRDGMANLLVAYGAPCGSVLLRTGSVDHTGSYVFEVPPENVGKSWGRSSQFWQVGAGTDTMFSIWNPISQPEDLTVSVFYEPGGIYEYPLHLDPNTSVMISIMDLIHKAVPDKNSSVIPATTRMGSLKVTSRSQDLRDAVTFVMRNGIYNPVSGTCCNSPITCHGEISTYINPSSFTVAVGNTQGLHLIVNEDNGNILDYTSSAYWSSSSPNILSIQQGTGTATGISPGTTVINASVSGNVPVYVPNFCGYEDGGQQCPYGGAGASGSGKVAPKITNASPTQGLPGDTITLNGAGFTPSPSVTFGGSSVAPTSSNSTKITFVIPVTASGGSATVSVTVAAQISNSVTVTVQIPTYFSVVSRTVSFSLGCVSGTAGYGTDVTYRVLDQNFGNILKAGLVPQEHLPPWPAGQFEQFATPPSTDANGEFLDTPVGTCFGPPVPPTNVCINTSQTFNVLGAPPRQYPITTVTTRRDCLQGQRLSTSTPAYSASFGTVN